MGTGKWLAIIGVSLVIVGFFLPLVGVTAIVNLNVSLSQIAGILNQVMLYLVPISMIVILIFCLITPVDSQQAKTYGYIQIAAWIVSIFGIFITFYSLYNQIHQGTQLISGLIGGLGGLLEELTGTDLTGLTGGLNLSPRLGFYLLFSGHILAIAGAIMELNDVRTPSNMPLPPYPEPGPIGGYEPTVIVERRPTGKVANAWLVSRKGTQHQLYIGETSIGRSSRSHIRLSDDRIGRDHAKIVEQNGHFTLYDLASKNGTFVNSHRVYQPIILQSNDEIDFGGVYKVTFVAPHR